MSYLETLAEGKIHRLYEQRQTAPERVAALDECLTRWKSWTTAGLRGLALSSAFTTAIADARKAKAK